MTDSDSERAGPLDGFTDDRLIGPEGSHYLVRRFGILTALIALALVFVAVYGKSKLSLSIGLGALAALSNLWLSGRWLRKLITPTGAVSTVVGVLLLKILGLLLLAYLMIVVRAAEPFSLGLAFVTVTMLAAFLLGLPRRGPPA